MRSSHAALAPFVAALVALALLGGPAFAGELIRYRTAEGEVGWTDSPERVPDGAEIVRRGAPPDRLTRVEETREPHRWPDATPDPEAQPERAAPEPAAATEAAAPRERIVVLEPEPRHRIWRPRRHGWHRRHHGGHHPPAWRRRQHRRRAAPSPEPAPQPHFNGLTPAPKSQLRVRSPWFRDR